ncbi:SAM domain and HD, partial [Geranomyces variabilis]
MHVITDSVHGAIEINDYCMQIIDTPQFQRLRDLKQLGSSYFVYPGAAHNRFEHSIGVSYLAGQMIEHIRTTQPELDVTDKDVKCVKMAGLCHDLGHGPFSHLFNNVVVKRARPDLNWTHEVASEAMLEYLVDNNDHVTVDADELRFIQELIRGRPEHGSARKRFLFDIVANKRNSVDVDKFDYILRDCHNVGIKSSLDVRRLMTYCRVIDDQICFGENVAFNLYEMFQTRYSLFRQVYTHRAVRTIDLMLADTLLAADKYLGISDSVLDMSRYQHITDSIIKQIERSRCEELAVSRAIIQRLRKRDLYQLVDQVKVSHEMAITCASKITAESVHQHAAEDDQLTVEDIIVTWHELGYAMNDSNPIDSVKFYDKKQVEKTFHVERDK